MADERQHRKERLAAAFRLFAHFGYEEGITGHISVRDPEEPESFWVNPFGMTFGHITVSDLVRVGPDGSVVEGKHDTHEAPFSIHSQLYAARPDVQSAAHSHTLYAKTLASFGELLAPITQDACAFYQDQGYFDDYVGVILTDDQGRRLASALDKNKALLLRNHGLITVGGSVDAAAWWFISFEESSRSQLLARAAGEPIEIDHENALRARSEIGKDFSGWLNFQPYYQMITRLQPDLLE
ncbi:class II aldolase/adducin family protein [Spirillospora sp. NBC_00431]